VRPTHLFVNVDKSASVAWINVGCVLRTYFFFNTLIYISFFYFSLRK